MKVLCIEAAYGFGGSLTGLLELFRYLPPDIEPILATPFDPWTRVDRPANLQHFRVDIQPPPPKTEGHWLPGMWRYYRDYLRPWKSITADLIARHQPDLVYAGNSLSINYGVGLAARAAGLPSVCHQKDFEYPGRLMQLMGRRSPFTHHIAMSRSVQQQLESIGVPADRCTEIFDPMTPPHADLVRRRRSATPHDPPTVAMHSMIIHWKGQHVFVDAIAELARRGVTSFTPIIAGSPPAGEPEYLDTIREQADKLGVLERLEFPGHQKDVYEYLTGVDIAVHASVDPEPFGRVVPEVMLMGIPGVVSVGGGPAATGGTIPLGGPSEYVIDGRTGLHAPCDDPIRLADQIESLLAMTPEDRNRMGDAAREYAEQSFAPEALSARMVDVFRRVAGG